MGCEEQMRYLLVGGEGYIGRVLQEEIITSGHEYLSIDNNLLGLAQYNTLPGMKGESVFGDTLDKISFRNTLEGKEYDVLINLAAVVGDPACLVDTRFALQNNCVGTRNMVERANKEGKKIIHLSTCSLYGAENCSEKNPLTETDKTFPIDFYGQTKYQQERFVVENSKNYCVFRLGTAYGQSPRMRYDLVIPTFTAKAIKEGQLTVFGGNQWRPFVHIRDVARAIIFAVDNDLKGVYNLANENVTIKQVAQKIKEAIPKTRIEINTMIEDPRNYIVSNKKILETGFKFRETIIAGIKEMMSSPTIKEYDRVIYHNNQLAQLKKNGIKL